MTWVEATWEEWAGPGWEAPEASDERRRWRDRIDDPRAWNVVAAGGDELLGCVSFTDARDDDGRVTPARAHLTRLFVAPEHWGRGIGGELMRHAVEEMRGRGYSRAQLFTPAANAPARGFYERHGWRLSDARARRWRGLPLARYALDLR